jgi:Dullard-like phosphatase family protein
MNFDIERLLVFDLDETLVHCIHNDKGIKEADVYLDITLPNGKVEKAGFNIRPYWREMMDEIKDDWEVVVFTASCKNYADSIIDYLDPEGTYFPHRFYRESCWLTSENVYVKDLRIFHQWDLKDIILVDNAVYSFGFQLDNGIPIFPYIKGKDDMQLMYLKEYLKAISSRDIIPDLKKTFQMSYLYKCDIDSFLDYYEDEDGDEDNDDILDQMISNDLFRKKAQSFQSIPLMLKTKSYTETILKSTEKDRLLDSITVTSNEIPRSFSGNVDEVRQHAELIDSQLVEVEFSQDQDQNLAQIDQESSDSKRKGSKKRKAKFVNMKKFKSQ